MALLITPTDRIRCNAVRVAQVSCDRCGAAVHLDALSPRLRRLVHGLARVHKCVAV